MESKIEKLKLIISKNAELNKYSDLIQDNWAESQLIEYVQNILTDYHRDHQEKPAFCTELQTLLNKYDKDNIYTKPTTNQG